MEVPILDPEPLTVEELLYSAWPSDLYGLLDDGVLSGGLGPVPGPTVATPPPITHPDSMEGPGGPNPLVFEGVPVGGPVPEPAKPGLDVQVLLLPYQGVTAGHLPCISEETLSGFLAEFPRLPCQPSNAPPLVPPGLFSHSLGTQDTTPAQGHTSWVTNQGTTPRGTPHRRVSHQQMQRREKSLLWNIKDIKRRMWNRLFHHNTSHKASCPTHCVQALKYQKAELSLKNQRLRATQQTMRLCEGGPVHPPVPLPGFWGSGPSSDYSTPHPSIRVYKPSGAPVAPQIFPNLLSLDLMSTDLMALHLGPADSAPGPPGPPGPLL